MLKIAVIGGGPAGFMAAVSAMENKNQDISIDIYDKNEVMKKILVTGHGRCNLTNEIYNFKELASNYPRGEKFLYSAFSRFGVKDTFDWFQWHGVELYTQDDNRVFPETNDANTIRDILLDTAINLGIKVRRNTGVTNIKHNDDGFTVYAEKSASNYDKIIISTGGNPNKTPYSGYTYAENLGHKITDLRPALSALLSKEKWPAKVAGVSITDTQISAYFEGKQIASARGDFIFTHEGLSGPLIFKISSYCAFVDYNSNNLLVLKINFLPDMNKEELEKEILDELNKNSKKSLINIIKDYAPRSLVLELLNNINIDSEKKASQISKEDRKLIIKMLLETELTIKSPKPEGEIVTAGGVELNEIDPKTMESKLVKGLYFCGEILNVDGLTGGFNLQACWSTGYIAGLNASSK